MCSTKLIVPRNSRAASIPTLGEALAIAVLTSFLIKLYSESQLLPEDSALQSVRIKEEQLRREEEKVRRVFRRVLILC